MVDEYENMFVYSLRTQEMIHQEANVRSCCWNAEMDDMLAFTGQGQLFIKTGELPPTSQRLSGDVVGFKDSKIFVL